MKQASFIEIEDEHTDLILSFAIENKVLGIQSLILIRTPDFEFILPQKERGVHVSFDSGIIEDNDLLKKISIKNNIIEITSNRDHYEVDISKIDKSDIKKMISMINKLNFDSSFELTIH